MCGDAEWYLTAEEAETLWDAARRASSGVAGDAVDIGALFRVIRGSLPPRRAATVHNAFARLSGSTGSVSLDRLASAYQAAKHPDVVANRRQEKEVTAEFLDTFGVQARTELAFARGSSGNVLATEFEDYYADLSPGIADDAYFDLLVFGVWPNR